MTTLTWEPTTAPAIAALLGLDRITVSSWAVSWHGPIGTGNRRRLTTVDRFVARAWQVLSGNYGGNWGGNGYGRSASPLMRQVEAAIRRRPRAWLLVAGYVIETYDTAEEAAAAWLDSGQPAAQLIDLFSVPEESPDA